MNIVLVGPCGVGKSTIGKYLCNKESFSYIDWDEAGSKDISERKNGFSPFSVGYLDLMSSCPLVLDAIDRPFLLDFGGDNIFRKGVDNNQRLDQVHWLKENYSSQIYILTATRDVFEKRFYSSKGRNKGSYDEFPAIWNDWVGVILPWWNHCGDYSIDTSDLTPDLVSERIMKLYRES